MSEKLTMPKNVQAFVNKYGSIGSKEQDATFWKEFRKAANAYAGVQAKRICDLEHDLTTVTAQRDEARKIAAIRTGRKAIGIEKDPEHFKNAVERIKRELAQGDLFLGQNADGDGRRKSAPPRQ
jgi:anthranilate/para-aminobenzoate synthase component I